MIRILILSLLIISCKKSEIKQDEKTPKSFSAKTLRASYFEVTKNGIKSVPPFNVYNGDNVTVDCKSQVSTPKSYDMTVFFYLDGVDLGGCSNCAEYKNTFIIQ